MNPFLVLKLIQFRGKFNLPTTQESQCSMPTLFKDIHQLKEAKQNVRFNINVFFLFISQTNIEISNEEDFK